MILKRQGYYREMPHAEETDPSMKEYIGKKFDYKKEICQYLQKGIVLAACGEVSRDILRSEKGIAGTPDEMTDGKYIWPGDLAYYVLNYDLQLNKEFIDYMIEHEWTVPNDLEIDFDNLEVQ